MEKRNDREAAFMRMQRDIRDFLRQQPTAFSAATVFSTNLVSELRWINIPLPRRPLLHALELERIKINDISW